MNIIQHVMNCKNSLNDFDVVIIGSGPSGYTVARTLAEKGRKALILEAGPPVPPGTILTAHQSAYSRCITEESAHDGNPWTACCVGGGMEFYSAITFRYREADLRASRHLQSDLTIDWPIEIDEMEEHYDYIENLLGLENLYTYPLSARGRRIGAAMTSLGYRASKMPLAISSAGGKNGCSHCSACDSRSCPSNAKASVRDRLMRHNCFSSGSITVAYGCVVKKINLINEVRAGSVECYIPFSGETISVHTENIICCANAVQSAALLLRSTSPLARTGIGNENDLLGRGISFKVSGYSTGIHPDWHAHSELGSPHQGAPATVYTDDFYQSPLVPTGMGGLIYEAASPVPEKNIGCIRIHYLAGEEPWSHNRITLDDKEDDYGIPLIRYSYKNTDRDIARLNFLAARAEDILRSAGARTVQRETPVYQKGSSHLHGTARAGTDPVSSVVDPSGKIHGYDNIYVMDASVMNFAGNWNPTHTIMANARRMALAMQ
ncbi:GMC family oxidoreductase [Pantoea vagans]|uniref:GMC family oxidoreductase n=1 Tax=Pantoea vagans TaxID=470934 RepID=UPI003016DCF0